MTASHPEVPAVASGGAEGSAGGQDDGYAPPLSGASGRDEASSRSGAGATARPAAENYRRDAGLARLEGRGARPRLERDPDGLNGPPGASGFTRLTNSASDTRGAARAQA